MVIEETKRLMMKISAYPFWVRFPLWLALSISLAINHWYLTHKRFPQCPKEECPPLSIFDNCNKWRYPEKAQMERLQQGHRELWALSIILLIPDWAVNAIQLYQIRQEKMRKKESDPKYQYTRKTKDEIKKSKPPVIWMESSV